MEFQGSGINPALAVSITDQGKENRQVLSKKLQYLSTAQELLQGFFAGK